MTIVECHWRPRNSTFALHDKKSTLRPAYIVHPRNDLLPEVATFGKRNCLVLQFTFAWQIGRTDLLRHLGNTCGDPAEAAFAFGQCRQACCDQPIPDDTS